MSETPNEAEGVEGESARPSRWERRAHLRCLEAVVYDGWRVPQEIYDRLPRSLIDIADDPLASTRDRIRATEALAHLIQHRTDTAVQLDRILRLDAGQATDRVQVLDGISDAQLAAVAASILPPALPVQALPPADAPQTLPKPSKPRRGRKSRP